ncbi:MAG: hypothetical protein ABS76_17285 [Pelagibacterium sp. SCN 64-44]|nr:MAG: hypothetical protein ABS76_17285 [Pelagibacterium sp. SCN 64-44]
MNIVRLWPAAAAICFAASAQAGEFTLVSQYYAAGHPVPHLHYEGPVTEGDVEQLRALFDANIACGFEQFPVEGGNCAVISLHSPGGNYVEGLMLAQFLRDNRIASIVEPGAECYSACAFAFLGGTGYSSQDNVGIYVDRMVAPGAILGFHAPYFAPESLDGLVAQFGLDTVLGASRDDISLMVRELVNWNVDENVLGYIVSMGPDETYDILTGEDYFLTRTALPPELAFNEQTGIADAVYNACIYLLAEHESQFPSALLDRITEMSMSDIGVDSFGAPIVGYRLGADNPLGLTFCGLPTAQLEGNGDADIALYTGAGIQGDIRPMLTFFMRPNGWSSLGGTGNISRSIFQKGAMNTMFLDPISLVEPGLFH